MRVRRNNVTIDEPKNEYAISRVTGRRQKYATLQRASSPLIGQENQRRGRLDGPAFRNCSCISGRFIIRSWILVPASWTSIVRAINTACMMNEPLTGEESPAQGRHLSRRTRYGVGVELYVDDQADGYLAGLHFDSANWRSSRRSTRWSPTWTRSRSPPHAVSPAGPARGTRRRCRSPASAATTTSSSSPVRR